MAPGYRNQNRRQNRSGHVDHDVFEGLPVRHWRRDYVTVAPPPTIETSTSLNDIWAIELPHGMPKDYHLLPQHSQDLLRGARSGRIYKRPAQVEEDEVDLEGAVPEKVEKKEDDTKDRGFAAKAWKQVPRHLEGPDLEYLAKRKKNVITIGSKAPKVVPTVTKATMKRIDAAGNEYTQDVIVPLGQHIEGEIISQTEIPDPSLTAPEGLAIQPSPVKRKPVIKKKHKAGPGRGRKKKLIAPTSAPIDVDGSAAPKPISTSPSDDIKKEDGGSVPPAQGEDIEMRDDSAGVSDNDESDEGDDDGDEDEESVASGSPSKRVKLDDDLPPLPESLSIPSLPPPMPSTSFEPSTRPALQLDERTKSGSPLKFVALASPTATSPAKEAEEGKKTDSGQVAESTPPLDQAMHQVDVEMQKETSDLAPELIPPAPPAPTEEVVQSIVELRKEEEAEEEMLLDIQEEVEQQSKPELEPIPVRSPEAVPAAIVEEVAPNSLEVPLDAEALPLDVVTAVPEAAKNEEGEESETDLLGDLEKSLAKP